MLCFVLYLAFLIFVNPNDITWTALINDEELCPEKNSPSKTGKKIVPRAILKGSGEGIMVKRPESRRTSRHDMRNVNRGVERAGN
jgi:hypothetical protein